MNSDKSDFIYHNDKFLEVWKRLRKKGGTLHMSKECGVIAYIKDEEPTVLVEPINKGDNNEL